MEAVPERQLFFVPSRIIVTPPASFVTPFESENNTLLLVLSKGTAKVDKEDKFQEYERAGVQEYWIVDPFKQNVEIYTLEHGNYSLFGKWGTGEIAKSKLLDGFEVSIDEIMI